MYRELRCGSIITIEGKCRTCTGVTMSLLAGSGTESEGGDPRCCDR